MFRQRNNTNLGYNSSKARNMGGSVEIEALDLYNPHTIALESIKSMLRQNDISLASIHLNNGATEVTLGVQDVDGGPYQVTLTPANSSFASWVQLYPRLTSLHAAPIG